MKISTGADTVGAPSECQIPLPRWEENLTREETQELCEMHACGCGSPEHDGSMHPEIDDIELGEFLFDALADANQRSEIQMAVQRDQPSCIPRHEPMFLDVDVVDAASLEV